MTSSRKVLILMGTRPEAVKLLPVVEACRRTSGLHVILVATGQHRAMLDQVLEVWQVRPDIDLDLMHPNQDLTTVTSAILERLRPELQRISPDVVVVQGDTTTSFAGALASYYAKVPIAHVEAGLRTGKKYAPFPEEVNRHLTTVLADVHFAPTNVARENLLREGVAAAAIHVTGNTVIDALLQTRERFTVNDALRATLERRFGYLDPDRRLVLVTAHRRESFGGRFEEICLAIRDLVSSVPDIDVVYPVHLNPAVREPVNRLLRTAMSESRLHLVEPLPYVDFVYLLSRCYLVLTDSGGVQEEAPALGKPVLVMRDVTERPEVVSAGAARLVGTRRESIVQEASQLLSSPAAYAAMATPIFPYGDGRAADRIASVLVTFQAT